MLLVLLLGCSEEVISQSPLVYHNVDKFLLNENGIEFYYKKYPTDRELEHQKFMDLFGCCGSNERRFKWVEDLEPSSSALC